MGLPPAEIECRISFECGMLNRIHLALELGESWQGPGRRTNEKCAPRCCRPSISGLVGYSWLQSQVQDQPPYHQSLGREWRGHLQDRAKPACLFVHSGRKAACSK
jgi:hypothetical protein